MSAGETNINGRRTVAPLRVAVVGAGAFGRNHVRVYSELQQAGAGIELCAVVDRDPEVLAAVRAQYGIVGYATVAELLAVGTRGRH